MRTVVGLFCAMALALAACAAPEGPVPVGLSGSAPAGSGEITSPDAGSLSPAPNFVLKARAF